MQFRAQPQSMTRFRHAPVTLAALNAELQPAGINLNDEIRTRLRAWAGIANDSVRRLSSRLAIVVVVSGHHAGRKDRRRFARLHLARHGRPDRRQLGRAGELEGGRRCRR